MLGTLLRVHVQLCPTVAFRAGLLMIVRRSSRSDIGRNKFPTIGMESKVQNFIDQRPLRMDQKCQECSLISRLYLRMCYNKAICFTWVMSHEALRERRPFFGHEPFKFVPSPIPKLDSSLSPLRERWPFFGHEPFKIFPLPILRLNIQHILSNDFKVIADSR